MKYKDYLKLHPYRQAQHIITTCCVCGEKMSYDKRGGYKRRFCGNACAATVTKNTLKKGWINSTQGYIKVLVHGTHSRKDNNNYVMRSILVVEKFLGRRLKRNEVVHHRDGNKTNDHISNLMIMSAREHNKYHAEKGRRKYEKKTCTA